MQNQAECQSAGLRSSPVKKLNQESEAWFDYTPSVTSSPRNGATGPGKLNGNQNWYRHDTEVPAGMKSPRDLNPIGVSQSKLKTRCSEERRTRDAAAGDPNDWYRHDHQGAPPGTDTPDAGVARRPAIGIGSSGSKKPSPVKTANEETMWFAQNGSAQTTDNTTKTRHSGQDADSYYRRDKTGSGSNWFPHEHSSADVPDTSSVSPSGPRGSGRMNLESPAWFSHENPPQGGSPRPAVSPEVRKMQARAAGDDVRQILRVDENLNHQHQQPPQQQQQQQHATDTPPTAHYTETLIDKFQIQVSMTTAAAATDDHQ